MRIVLLHGEHLAKEVLNALPLRHREHLANEVVNALPLHAQRSYKLVDPAVTRRSVNICMSFVHKVSS